LPAWLLQAPVLLEFVAVLELSLLAAIATWAVWLDAEDKPSAFAFGFLLAIVIARCWHMWWRASRHGAGRR
jgi:sterol desaturase/sphingolipid hydroxylase (fatty acid hydroxylase superfamily)